MKVFGQHDDQTLAQLRDVASRAVRVSLMADGHLGYIMPIGGVAAYRNEVSVAGVGFDIACGNAAILTDLTLSSGLDLEGLADEIWHTFSFGVGGENGAPDAPTDHALFGDPAWEHVPREHRDQLRDRARRQLGTIGSGNHYIDVFADEQERLWVGVHFGSRGFGHSVASGFLALAEGLSWGSRAPQDGGVAAARLRARLVVLATDEPGRQVRLRRPRVGSTQGGAVDGRLRARPGS